MATAVQFKQGTTFGFTATYTQDGPTAPPNLNGVTVKVAFRDAGYNYYPLAVTTTSPTTFDVLYPLTTIGWVTGTGYFDIQMTYDAGSVFYTETVQVDVLPSITGTSQITNPAWA
jgi:hypothetical protein